MFTLYLHILSSTSASFLSSLKLFYDMLAVTSIEKSVNSTCVNVYFDFFLLSPDNNISISIRH